MLPFWYRCLYLLNGLLNEYYYKTKKKTVAAAVEGASQLRRRFGRAEEVREFLAEEEAPVQNSYPPLECPQERRIAVRTVDSRTLPFAVVDKAKG